MINSAHPSYVYRVDERDRIVHVSDLWIEFARENGAPELDRDTVCGASLWRFIAGSQSQHIYRLLLDRARTTLGTYVVPFRCDAPGLRRHMELEIEGFEDRTVELTSVLLSETPRSPMTLLDPDTVRDRETLHMCGWCKRVNLGSAEWVEVEEAVARLGLFKAPVPQVSHGVCPSCTMRLEAS